jgi:predicted dehydrogenase
LGLFQKDINVAWDLAPHDISIVLNIMGERPLTVNCRGSAHIAPGVEDVTTMCLSFSNQRSAIIHSSWLDPRKVREMTIVGSKRMIVYDDVASLEKIRIFDARVERPPHYDTFAEFHYAYHYGDVYAPYIKQEEPLKTECQHFLDCIRDGVKPLTDGSQGLEMVRILEASSESLAHGGSPVELASMLNVNGSKPARSLSGRPARLAAPKIVAAKVGGQKIDAPIDPKLRIKIQVNENQENGHVTNGNGHQVDAQ